MQDEIGFTPTIGQVVTRHDMENYLQANTYFRLRHIILCMCMILLMPHLYDNKTF